MGVLNIVTSQTGLVGVLPRVIFINTNNTAAQVQAPGYLTKVRSQGESFSNKDMALVYTTDAGLLWMDVIVTASNVGLSPNGNSISAHDIQAGIFTSAPDTGLANAYVVNLTPPFNPLTSRALFTTVFQSANTGASTIEVNGATYNLVNMDGSPLATGAILIGQFGLMGFDGTNVQLLNSALSGSLGILPVEIQNQSFTFADDDGAANTYHADYSPAITLYVKGMRLTFNTVNANTGASSFAANGLSAPSIVLADGSSLVGGEIPANSNVDVMMRDDGNWQLMGVSTAGGGSVTPQDIQQQKFDYAIDTSGTPNLITVALSPAITAYNDGLAFEFIIANDTTSNTVQINVNGLGPIDILGSDGNPLIFNSMFANRTYGVTYDVNNNVFYLHNPAGGTERSSRLVQEQFATYAIDSGTTNAYVGAYNIAPLPADGATYLLRLQSTNTSTSVTFDNGDGNGPQPVVDVYGNLPAVGALQFHGIYSFTWNNTISSWQVNNIGLSGSSPTPHAFSAYLNSDFITPNDPGPNAITGWSTSGYNAYSNPAFNATTGEYTAQVSGPHFYSSTIEFNSGGSEAKIPYIYVNGSQIKTSQAAYDIGGATFYVLVGTLDLNAGDIVSIQCASYDGTTSESITIQGLATTPVVAVQTDFTMFPLSVGSGGGSVTPADIQNQTFSYCIDTSGTANQIICAANPTVTALTDGLKISVKVANNSINGIGFTLALDATGAQPITPADDFSLLGNTFVAGKDYEFTWESESASWILTSTPAVGTEASAIAIQQGTWNTSNDSGVADAYVGTYLPTVSYSNTLRLYLTNILHTNTTPTPTFNAGLGTAVIVRNDGSPLQAGDIPAGGSIEVVWNSPNWLLQNPSASGAGTAQIVGTFTPTLTNYTLNGGTGLVATGNYVETGANMYITTKFTNPGGSFGIYGTSPVISGLPALPVVESTATFVGTQDGVVTFAPYAYEYTYTITPTGNGEGITHISQSGNDYLIITDSNSVMHALKFQTTTSSPYYSLTQVDTLSVFDGYFPLNSFNFSGTDYIIWTKSAIGNNTFQTVPFSGGAFGSAFNTTTTHYSSGQLVLFVDSGIQYCLYIGAFQYLETFSFNGSTWTSVDVFDTTDIHLSLPFIFTLSGVTYCVISDYIDGKIFTYSWTGSTWTSAASDITLAGAKYVAVNVYDGTPYLLVGLTSGTTLYSYTLSGSTWSAGPTFTIPDTTTAITTFTLNNIDYYAWIDFDGDASIYSFSGGVITDAADYKFAAVVPSDPTQIAIIPAGLSGYFFFTDDSLATISGQLFTADITPVGGGIVLTDGTISSNDLASGFSDLSELIVSATYECAGPGGGGNVPVKQQVSLLTDLSFTAGSGQVLIFDSVVGTGMPTLYNTSTGTFTFPFDGLYEFNFQGIINGDATVSAVTFVNTATPAAINYTIPVTTNGSKDLVIINTIQNWAAGGTMQVQFDATGSSSFSAGSGASTLISTVIYVTYLG